MISAKEANKLAHKSVNLQDEYRRIEGIIKESASQGFGSVIIILKTDYSWLIIAALRDAGYFVTDMSITDNYKVSWI